MDIAPFTFFDMLSSLPLEAACTVSFIDLSLDPVSMNRWKEIADEYDVDTISSFAAGTLTYALPLPQFGCLIEEGVFKAAAIAMQARGEWHSEFEPPCWLVENFDWEGAQCGAVAIEFTD